MKTKMKFAIIVREEVVYDVVEIDSIEKLSGFRNGLEQLRKKTGADIICKEIR